MSLGTLQVALEKVIASGLAGPEISIVWHAGEPLTVPLSYYEAAFGVIDRAVATKHKVSHSIQTNATLIDNRWCDFIREHGIKVGVSLDGPAFLHDTHRRDRRGRGTHARAMSGIERLQEKHIPFHVIAVVSAQSLEYPEEIVGFFLDKGIHFVGFNIEELEGVHAKSSLASHDRDGKMAQFWRRVFELQRRSAGAIRIREFDRAFQAIAAPPDLGPTWGLEVGNEQVRPFGILSIDCDGNISTFSPELLGARSAKYGSFSFGNVGVLANLTDILNDPSYQKVARDIQAGVERCAASCEYFQVCGGGAPSNKYFENGTFASTETMYCRYAIKAPFDLVLSALEDSLTH